MFDIVIADLTGQHYRMAFETNTVTVGRGPQCDLVLPAPNISTFHCQIHQRDERFILVDLDSTNGTYVNGVRVKQPLLVRRVDRISLGGYVMFVERHQQVLPSYGQAYPPLRGQPTQPVQLSQPVADPPPESASYESASYEDARDEDASYQDADPGAVMIEAALPTSSEVPIGGGRASLFIPTDVHALYVEAEEPEQADVEQMKRDSLLGILPPSDVNELLVDADEPKSGEQKIDFEQPDAVNAMLLEAEEPSGVNPHPWKDPGHEAPQDASQLLIEAGLPSSGEVETARLQKASIGSALPDLYDLPPTIRMKAPKTPKDPSPIVSATRGPRMTEAHSPIPAVGRQPAPQRGGAASSRSDSAPANSDQSSKQRPSRRRRASKNRR
jgi:hypothetical protein